MYQNKVLVQGQIFKLNEVYRNEKGRIVECILLLSDVDQSRVGLVKLYGRLAEQKDLKEGLPVKVEGYLNARLSKDNRWFGEVVAQNIEVLEPQG